MFALRFAKMFRQLVATNTGTGALDKLDWDDFGLNHHRETRLSFFFPPPCGEGSAPRPKASRPFSSSAAD
jgi:hypothetical protein